MSKRYPYIQDREKIKDFECEVCHQVVSDGLRLEWRVDWFQGNCEFEKICHPCLNKRNQEEQRKQEEYEKKMEPIWQRQKENREKREDGVKAIISELGLSLQEFDNGQWSIGGMLDWWTTTGTAIERKTKKRYHLSFKKPDEIRKLLTQLT